MGYKDRTKRPLRGLCTQCPNPIAPLRTRCRKCLKVDNDQGIIKMERLRAKRRLEGDCQECGTKLDKIADKNRVSCINCRERKQ